MTFIIGFIIIIIVLYLFMKSIVLLRIKIPFQFFGTWKNDEYKLIVNKKTIILHDPVKGYTDLALNLSNQTYSGGYSFFSCRPNDINYFIRLQPVGGSLHFTKIILCITEFKGILVTENLLKGKQIVKEVLDHVVEFA